MPKLTVDGIEVEVPSGSTVLQACEAAGREVPRFCYHDRLKIAGNCRMCLVEMEKGHKPVASCAMPAGDNMVVYTDSENVRQWRRNVMEFLLMNHPLDCPICDQGGECDLQDQAVAYGMDHGRYREAKRAVPDKDLGPLIRTEMTRCIHCTRCVRFITDIAGVPELGMVGRGDHSEITTYVEKALSSELSGNIIDLCPVGALTNAPAAFHGRPWELRHADGVDVSDALGANIRIDTQGNAVRRVLPRLHEDVNQEWLADRGRFMVDALARRRLDRPWLRASDGTLKPATWNEALTVVADRLKATTPTEKGAIVGGLADAEAMGVLADLWQELESPHLDCREDGQVVVPGAPASWRFNTTLAGLDRADAVLLIGTNPRGEAPVLNARLRARWLTGMLTVGRIGPDVALTYRATPLGADASALDALARGEGDFAAVLDKAERPALILGMGALTRADGAAVLHTAHTIAERYDMMTDGWNGFNVLPLTAARTGGLELGLLPGAEGLDTAGMVAAAEAGRLKLLYLLGADELPMDRLGDCFVVYQGHHGDAGAARADVVLPGAAYTEKDALYVNMEGRVQRGHRAVFPPGEAREDWRILRALAAAAGVGLEYEDLAGVRARLAGRAALFGSLDTIKPAGAFTPPAGGVLDMNTPFHSPVSNYYRTDVISRASPTMAACSRVHGLDGDQEGKTGTNG